MNGCIGCWRRHYLLSLSCGCSAYCLECTVQFFRQQVTDQLYSLDPHTTCPFYHSLPVEEALEVVKGSEDEDNVVDDLCRSALARMRGSSYCPREGCGYVGWVDTANPCLGPVVCRLCQLQWVDEQLWSIWLALFRAREVTENRCILLLESAQSPSYTALPRVRMRWLEHLLYQLCPRCGSFTPAPSRSKHSTTCSHCRLSFCWNCQRPSEYHRRRCPDSTVFWRIVTLLMAAFLLLKVSTAFDIVPWSNIGTAVWVVLTTLTPTP